MVLLKKNKFYQYLGEISLNLTKSIGFFVAYQITNEEELKTFSTKMKEFEDSGDKIVHKIIEELNKVFITPIEREDILALTMSIDDVLDGLEHIAARMEIYRITKPDTYMQQFAQYIQKSTNEISQSIEWLASKKLQEMQKHAIQIKEYETKCDEILRISLINLFQNESNPITIIQYKEIYEKFEEVTDYCQVVANTIEAIIMKNA